MAIAAACVFAIGTATAADAPTHEIKAPHYGDTLFHFFQDHHFTAITTLMVSQKFERVSEHADEAEVLRGGMLLSYGLHREAGAIFAQLIEKGASPKVRDRAWFYLAKIRYQRGYLPEAEDALARVENNLPPGLEEERVLLNANLLMARADFNGAATALSNVNAKTPGARYVRFNLGIALLRAGDTARGTAVLDELGRAGAEDEEYRSLRDRANVALGFSALTNEQPKEARTYLERVRLNGLQSNKALLGFGWAADAMKEPKLALVPWIELAQRDVSDSAALEAKIAVPYAYAKLEAYGQSLDRYNDAIGAFERESIGLDESIAAVRSGKLIGALLERNPGEEMGWFQRLDDLPDLPHAGHLAPVLAQHEFQEAFKNYRDLLFLTKNLEEWHEKLGVFDDMLATRRKAFAERLPQVRARASATGIEVLRQRRDKVAAEIAAGEAAADGVAFADGKEVELLALVQRARATLEKSPASPEMDQARERLRLASGALTWQLAGDALGRAWNAKKELVTIDTQVGEAQQRDAALAQAQRDEPERFERFGKRIAALDPLLQAMLPKVAALSKEQQAVVQEIAVAELTRQKERLAVYTTQARFAVAQLYDRANVKKEADHAAAPR
ncbi:MAG: tetratricopeptide repeat protein [Burkholderiales bacterium]